MAGQDQLTEDLRQCIEDRQVVALVGAGVSIGASGRALVASWLGLLEDGIGRAAALHDFGDDWVERKQADLASRDLDEILGDAPQALPQGPGTEIIEIPPRPLQISWPDTGKLKHCLGQHIDVRIQVDADGSILHIVAHEGDHPADCLEAAVESAKQIIFAPGTINGKPARMWTQIQIDFTLKK